ncbi:MAG: DUF4231 domain-containing protein [Terriglobia bacterium]
MPDADPTIVRLEDQINWYDRKSNSNQKIYKWSKAVEIGAAALVPLFSGLKLYYVTGGLGVLIAILEGMLQLGQNHHNGITYRSTCESLKHEKYLYLAAAGPYANAAQKHTLLAERIESLVSQENAKWAALQERAAKPGEAQ